MQSNITHLKEQQQKEQQQKHQQQTTIQVEQPNKQICLDKKNQAAAVFKKGDYQQAINLYKVSLNRCPNITIEDKQLKAIISNNIAVCLNHLKNYKQSIKWSAKAIQANSSYAKAYHTRIVANQQNQDYDLCVKDYDQLLKLDPSSKQLIYKRQQMKKRAQASFQQKKKQVVSGLKNLADGFLGYFGMSTNDFKVEQNQNGSYNIGMNKK